MHFKSFVLVLKSCFQNAGQPPSHQLLPQPDGVAQPGADPPGPPQPGHPAQGPLLGGAQAAHSVSESFNCWDSDQFLCFVSHLQEAEKQQVKTSSNTGQLYRVGPIVSSKNTLYIKCWELSCWMLCWYKLGKIISGALTSDLYFYLIM